MNSIKVKDFEFTLTKFIKDYDLPMEVKRLVLKEIYDDINEEATKECIDQAKEREENKDA